MGDHRASIKIEMEFHGIKDSTDMYINYAPDSSDYALVDYRIVEFVQSVYERGMHKWDESQEKYRRIEEERSERAEFERLKAKYQP